MKIVTLNKDGVKNAIAPVITRPSGKQFHALLHGEEGRGRWELRLPLAVKPYPVIPGRDRLVLDQWDYQLVPLSVDDQRGHPLYLITHGENDGKVLVCWSLSPGFRGGATWRVEGEAEVIGIGEEAQGTAGRMGGAECPLVLVSGPCSLHWHRTGRLYGSPADWVARFDGQSWQVAPVDDDAIETAAFNY